MRPAGADGSAFRRSLCLTVTAFFVPHRHEPVSEDRPQSADELCRARTECVARSVARNVAAVGKDSLVDMLVT
jgi:hypothetical protein